MFIDDRSHSILIQFLQEEWPEFEETRLILADSIEEAGNPRLAKKIRLIEGWVSNCRVGEELRFSPYRKKLSVLSLLDISQEIQEEYPYYNGQRFYIWRVWFRKNDERMVLDYPIRLTDCEDWKQNHWERISIPKISKIPK